MLSPLKARSREGCVRNGRTLTTCWSNSGPHVQSTYGSFINWVAKGGTLEITHQVCCRSYLGGCFLSAPSQRPQEPQRRGDRWGGCCRHRMLPGTPHTLLSHMHSHFLGTCWSRGNALRKPEPLHAPLSYLSYLTFSIGAFADVTDSALRFRSQPVQIYTRLGGLKWDGTLDMICG